MRATLKIIKKIKKNYEYSIINHLEASSPIIFFSLLDTYLIFLTLLSSYKISFKLLIFLFNILFYYY